MKRVPSHVAGPRIRGDLKRRASPSDGLLEVLRGLVASADQARAAWPILRRGVCAEADLPSHPLFCRRCVRELRLHTSPSLLPSDLVDAERLSGFSDDDLRALGRLPFPFLREAGERGFVRVSWDEALRRIGERVREIPPSRQRWRGNAEMSAEAAYALGRAARLLGGHGVEVHGRHPSEEGLVAALGEPGGTGTLDDLDADLVLVWGASLRQNHPAVLRRLSEAKRAGTRVVSIDVLDDLSLADDLVRVRPGGDAALAWAVLDLLDDWGSLDAAGLDAFTTGLPERPPSSELLARSGATVDLVEWLATLFVRSSSTCSLIGRGAGAASSAIAALHVATGRLGSPRNAVMPLQVATGWRMGLDPDRLPGCARKARNTARLSLQLGAPIASEWVPEEPEFVYTVGAPAAGPVRVHQLVHLDRSVTAPGELVVLLPAARPHEEAHRRGTLERRVVSHPAWSTPIGEARPGPEILDAVTRAVFPGLPVLQSSEVDALLSRPWSPRIHADGEYAEMPGCLAVLPPCVTAELSKGLQLSLRHGGPRGLARVPRSSGFADGDHVRIVGGRGWLPARIRLVDLLPGGLQLHADDAAFIGARTTARIERA